jgi:anaerobic C4-dicarboxylate transporter DcuA/anaerobic C4-dicarboxylate transporter DcuB
MDTILFILELAVVLGAIVMGTRSSGVALGVWGGFGVAVLVFVFGLEPGSPPVDAMLIIISVVLTAALMQVSGGIDWMVTIAAKAIRSRPKQITLIAPMMAFLFSVGAGTSNILYPLLPVIYDVSYKNKIRPSRPLSLAVVSTGVALACSPVSAAMAAMITLTDVAPYNFDLVKILSVTIPAAVIGIVLTSFVVSRLGKELEDDPEYQARLADGRLSEQADAETSEPDLPTATTEGRNAAVIFLVAVAAIVVFGLFPDLRPQIDGSDGSVPISMTTTIQLLMFTASALILLVSRPQVSEVPTSTVFKAGIVSAVALFGLAWLTDTFISAYEEQIVDTVGGWVQSVEAIFFLAVFIVCALTTSQSTATRTIVPIGLAAGLSPALVTGMWAGAFAGIYTLPTNGSQIAAANFDLTGSTQLGTKLIDHSFFVPMLCLAVSTAAFGSAFAVVLY